MSTLYVVSIYDIKLQLFQSAQKQNLPGIMIKIIKAIVKCILYVCVHDVTLFNLKYTTIKTTVFNCTTV